jgi:hypothetical protein
MTIDMAKLEHFMETLVGYMTGGAMCLGIWIGDEIGAYRAMAGRSRTEFETRLNWVVAGTALRRHLDEFGVPLDICARAYLKAARAAPLRKLRLCLRDQPIIDAVLKELKA